MLFLALGSPRNVEKWQNPGLKIGNPHHVSCCIFMPCYLDSAKYKCENKNNKINKIIMKEILSSASEKASLVDELDSILETTRIIRININF